MSSFISSAQDNLGGSNKAEELEGRPKEENGSLKQREFFWDNIVLFVVSTIIGLAAIDVITELIRGGGVACFPPLGAGVDVAQAAYINNFCSGFLPVGAYVPAFMVVHAILMTVPHYLWLNHYGGNFDFFFEQASCLKRSRDDKTGEHTLENLIIAQRLESTFTTYRRNSIYHVYILKLSIQFVWSLVGVGFAVGFFLSEFSARFMCPPNFNTTTVESWPLDEPVWCVFETLNLLHVLWIADILLLLLASFSLFWAIIWCFSTHTTELGSKEVARFAFESGLAPQYYISKLPFSSCFHSCFTSIPCISCSSPNVIKTDLDFLVMRLFLTDCGLGHVFKEVLIEKELKNLLDDDQRRLSFHGTKHKNRRADDSSYVRQRDYQDHALDNQDLKWLFSKTKNKVGIYRDFATLPQDQRLTLTSAMRGAILGLGARAPNNSNAMNISFGDSGYTTALARVFKWVAHLNFSPSYNNPDEVITVNHYYTNVVSLVFAEDILSSPSKDQNQFIGKLRDIWVPPNEEQFLDTGYIVIGPIPREKDFHLTSLDVLLETVAGCLLKDTVLVSIRPVKIEGKKVADDFIRYEPSNYRFSELFQESPIVASGHPRLPEWQARKSWQEAMNVQGGSSSSAPGQTSEQALETVQQPLLKSETEDKSPPTSQSEVSIVVPGSQSSGTQEGNVQVPRTIKQFRHSVEVTCGGSECEIEFSLYYYKDDPHVRRPRMYDSPTPSAAKLDVQSTPAGMESKVKNVNVEVDTKSKDIKGN